MKFKRLVFCLIFIASSTLVFGQDYNKTFTFASGGAGTKTEYTINELIAAGLPTELADVLVKNYAQVKDVFKEIDYNTFEKGVQNLKEYYSGHSTQSPVNDVLNGLDVFSGDLATAIANTQLVQNVWPQAWVGTLLPGVNLGAGLTVGASQLNITALKQVTKAINLDFLDSFPDYFVYPTISADGRIGGIYLPFDIGFTFMTLSTSMFPQIEPLLGPLSFSLFTAGGDFRWALLRGEHKRARFSVGAGYAYSSGSVTITDTMANASIAYQVHNIFLEAQLSKKFLFFVPFIGAKLGFAISNVSWRMDVNWSEVFETASGDMDKQFVVAMQEAGVLPNRFGGGYQGFNLIPTIYAGFGFDMVLLHLTISGGYDVLNRLASAQVNLRVAW